MLRFLQTADGQWHVTSVIMFIGAVVGLLAAFATFGIVIWRLKVERAERIRSAETKPIERVSGEIHLEFSEPIPLQQFKNDLPFVNIKKAPLSSSRTMGYFLIRSFGPEDNLEGGLTQKLSISVIDGRHLNTPNRLDTISARRFTTEADYLDVMGPTTAIPKAVSFWGRMKLTLNKTEYEFVIPRHNPSEFPALFVPLNEKARDALGEFALFNESQKGLLHFHDMNKPTKTMEE